jgi:hypothetical protein
MDFVKHKFEIFVVFLGYLSDRIFKLSMPQIGGFERQEEKRDILANS